MVSGSQRKLWNVDVEDFHLRLVVIHSRLVVAILAAGLPGLDGIFVCAPVLLRRLGCCSHLALSPSPVACQRERRPRLFKLSAMAGVAASEEGGLKALKAKLMTVLTKGTGLTCINIYIL